MANTKLDISISPSGTIMMLIIFAALAYFVYDHSIDAVIATVIVSAVIGVVILIASMIPVVGWLAAILACHYWVIPKMLDVVTLEHTWLITTIFVIIAFHGFAITVVMAFVVGGIIVAVMR